MNKVIFNRNVRASDQLELFLVAAISSLLAVRLYLHVTGYPQVGNESLHIAHMLWGGLLMLIAIVLLLAFIGYRIQLLGAAIGGIGFGVFIDELGKFITRDNDYFFQPAIAIIYAIFAILFLAFRALSDRSELTSREYLLNSLNQLEDVVLDDFDQSEKNKVERMLAKVDKSNEFAGRLRELIAAAYIKPTAKRRMDIIYRGRIFLDTFYGRLVRQRLTSNLVKTFFVFEAAFFLLAIAYLMTGSFTSVFSGRETIPQELLPVAIAEAVSAGIAALFVLFGILRFTRSRLDAYKLFRQAAIIQIFLTSFFAFYREEFGALPFLVVHIVLLVLLKVIISAEKRYSDA